MKKSWTPIALMIVCVGIGLPLFRGLSSAGKMPLWLRDHPWPLEVADVFLTLTIMGMLFVCLREKKRRVVTAICLVLAFVSTEFFMFILNVAAYDLPAPPSRLGLGAIADDFTLPDENGKPVTLSSLRGKPVLVLFYRGFW